jgi:dTMP kinase
MSLDNDSKPRGTLIVVEGLDRAGKTSQCQLLLEALRERGHQAEYIKFPGKSTPTDVISLD